MHSRYEVWRYSHSWGKWIRDIYPDITTATRRYQRLLTNGKKARPPRPFNRGLPLADRVDFLLTRIFKRTRIAGAKDRKLDA